jgi:hypothetical protein
MRAAQYANQFNAQNFEQTGVEGDANLRWTGDKVQQSLEAKKRYFEKLMNLKKLNINHPEYQNYIATRRKSYQAIMEDPSRKAAYRTRAKERQAKYTKKFTVRKQEIEKALQMALPATRKKELEEELFVINKQLENKKRLVEKSYKKKKEKIESDTLEGLTVKLMTSIANVKMGIKKNITAKLKSNEDTTFKAYKDQIAAAQNAGDNEAVLAATKALQKALNAVAESDEALVNYTRNSSKYAQLKEMLDVVHQQGWMDSSTPLEDVKPHLQSVLEMAKRLLSDDKMAVTFKSPNKTLAEIVSLIESRLSEKTYNAASRLDLLTKISAMKNFKTMQSML